MTPEQIEYEEHLRRLNELAPGVSRAWESMAGNAAQGESHASALQQSTNAVSRFAQVTHGQTATSEKLIAAQTIVIGSLKSFSTALLDTSDGLSKYGKIIDQAGDAAWNLGKQSGLLGTVIGGAIKGITVLGSKTLEYSDRIYKSYSQLADFGATVTLTASEFMSLGKEAGYTSHNLANFVKSAKSLDETLVALGGSASGGVKAFAKLSNITEEQIQDYKRLGRSQEEVTQMQAFFVKQTAIVGGALAKTPQQLQKESLAYIDVLHQMAELTGVSVEKQQESLKLALANDNFNAYIFDLEQTRAKKQTEADNLEEGAQKRALQAEATRLGQQIEATKVIGAQIIATDDAAIATAKLETISNKTGAIYTENNAKLLMSGQNMDRVNELLKDGKTFEAQIALMEENSKAVKKHTATFGEMAFSTGQFSRELNKTFGITNETRRNAMVADSLVGKTVDEQKKILADLGKSKSKTDPIEGMAVAANSAERAFRKTDDLLSGMFLAGLTKNTLAMVGVAAAAGAAALALSKLTTAATRGLFGASGGSSGVPGGAGSPTSGGSSTVSSTGLSPAQHAEFERLRAQGVPRELALTRASQIPSGGVGGSSGAGLAPTTGQKILGFLGKWGGRIGSAASIGYGGYKAHEGITSAEEARQAGLISEKEATKKKYEAGGGGVGIATGGIAGGWAGASAGAALGLMTGPAALVASPLLGLLGGLGGGYIGSQLLGWMGEKAGGAIGKNVADKDQAEKESNDSARLQAEHTEEIADTAKKTKTTLEHVNESLGIINKTLNELSSILDDDRDLDIVEKSKKIDKLLESLSGHLSSDMIEQIRKTMTSSVVSSSEATPFKGNQKEFYDKMYSGILAAAKEAQVKNPEQLAHIGASQAAIETGYGKNAHDYNYFNMTSGKTGVGRLRSDVDRSGRPIQQWFKTFNDPKEAYAEYVKFMQSNRYSKVLGAGSVEEGFRELGQSGYAEDPYYGKKTSSVFHKHLKSKINEAVPGYAKGGLVQGPKSGFPVELHGSELIAPLNPDSILAKLLTTASIDTAKTALESSNSQLQPTDQSINNFINTVVVMTEAMTSKLDQVIDKLSDGNYIQDQILKYNMV